MTIAELIEMRDAMNPKNADFNLIENLLTAMSDWPQSILTVEEFLKSINFFLGDERINVFTIRKKLDDLNANEDMWRIESLTSLLEICNNNPQESLDVILLNSLNIQS